MLPCALQGPAIHPLPAPPAARLFHAVPSLSLSSLPLSPLPLCKRSTSKQLFPRILLENLKQLPIKEASDKEALRLIELVEKMLTYNNRLRDSMGKRTDNITKIEEELNKIDFEINEFVSNFME